MTIQFNLPEEKYLWKFLDLYKFFSFVKNRQIVFSRLDHFNDSMETCSEKMAFWLINDLNIAEIIPSQRNPKLGSDVYEEKSKKLIIKLNTLKFHQKQFYASCFYAANEESIAMWKLYTGVEGVAIRFDSLELCKHLIEVYNKTLIDNMELGGNRMNYINLFRINPYTDDGKIKNLDQAYSPYNKDISYEYEQEYRFILVLNNPEAVDSEIKELKIELNENYFDFVVSPDTETWKKELLNQLISENGFTKKVKNSDIVTNEIVAKLKLKFLDDLIGDSRLPERTITKLYR